jgi:hypothetical protein
MKSKKEFDRVDNVLSNRKMIIHKLYKKELSLIQKSIGQSYLTNAKIHEFLFKQVRRTHRRIRGPKFMIPLVMDKNNHFLLAAYELSLVGLRNPTIALLRTVFEGVTRNYIYYLTKEAGRLLYNKDTETLTHKQKGRLKKLKYLQQASCVKILYNKKMREKMESLYRMLSTSTHPSIRSYVYDLQFKRLETEDTLKFLLMLTVANLMQITEVYLNILPKSMLKVNESLINKSARLTGSYPNLLPDKRRYANKINIRV